VEVPPLRSRPEDIFPLARHLVERTNWRLPYDAWKLFDEECRALLEGHSWPNNVRELETVVQRLFIHSEERIITRSDVAEHLSLLRVERQGEGEMVEEARTSVQPFRSDGSLKVFEEVKEDLLICESLRQYLGTAYKVAGRNWEEAARMIGVTDDTLRKYRRLLNRRGLMI
jgi:DNA-binding NtrC family response regulator